MGTKYYAGIGAVLLSLLFASTAFTTRPQASQAQPAHVVQNIQDRPDRGVLPVTARGFEPSELPRGTDAVAVTIAGPAPAAAPRPSVAQAGAPARTQPAAPRAAAPVAAAPPTVAPKAPPAQPRPVPSQQTFLREAAEAARETQRRIGVPASVTIAQAILESDWGRSKLARDGNNYFGIKALNGAKGSAGVVWMPTEEWEDDEWVTIQAPFRAYVSAVDSFVDHAEFLQGPRYRNALKARHDADEYARQIHAAGYATDPDYATKLINLMDRYSLYRYNG